MSITSSQLRTAGALLVAALGVAGLAACQPIQPAADLTIAATATSAEPAPGSAAIRDILIDHADAALFPGDGNVTVVTDAGVERVDLTPMRGDDVENSEKKRAEKIDEKLHEFDEALAAARASADGLDVIGVLDRALEATGDGGTVVLLTSGLATVAPMDLTEAGDWAERPLEFVEATAADALPDASGKYVVFGGIGHPAPASAQPAPGPGARSALEQILLGLCAKMNAAGCSIATGAVGDVSPTAVNTVPVVTFDEVATACVGEVVLDAEMLFGGDSPELRGEANAALAPIAGSLTTCAHTAVDAVGYTADVDCDNDPGDAADLAIARGRAVLDRLRALGAPENTIGAATNGGHRIDNCPTGSYDESLAQTNRAVVLTPRV